MRDAGVRHTELTCDAASDEALIIRSGATREDVPKELAPTFENLTAEPGSRSKV